VERIYAVDASPAMIDICKRDFDIPQLEFVTAGLRSFFEASAQLDGVYSAYTIHNMAQEDQVTIFKAIYARLRPGGCFVDGDLLAYSDPELQRITFQWQQEMVRKELPHDLAEQWIDHYNQDTPRYFTVEQLLSILSSIGFDAKLEYREKLEAVILARKP
jgi:SAM-dependent methyltransferase